MKLSFALSVARAAVATVVLVGCGSGQLGGTGGSGGSLAGTGGAGGTGGGEPLEMFAADYQTGYCNALVACNYFSDLATCEAVLDFPDGFDVRNIMASARRGTIAYDPVAAAACIAAVSQGCTITENNWANLTDQASLIEAFQTTSSCIDAFKGTVPLGGTCQVDSLECDSPDLWCGGAGCTAVCMSNTNPGGPPSMLGQDCSHGWCLLPGFCDGTTCVLPPDHLASCTTPYGCRYLDDYCGLAPGATTTTCIPRLPPGSPCTLGAPDGFGNASDPCQQQAQCLGGVCLAYGKLGGACTGNNECYSGICTNGACTAKTPLPDSCPIPM